MVAALKILSSQYITMEGTTKLRPILKPNLEEFFWLDGVSGSDRLDGDAEGLLSAAEKRVLKSGTDSFKLKLPNRLTGFCSAPREKFYS